MSEVKWVTKKPRFDKECLFIAATLFRNSWEYSVFTIEKVDGDVGWYWGIICGDGEEWGAIEDFRADKYLVMPLLKNKKK